MEGIKDFKEVRIYSPEKVEFVGYSNISPAKLSRIDGYLSGYLTLSINKDGQVECQSLIYDTEFERADESFMGSTKMFLSGSERQKRGREYENIGVELKHGSIEKVFYQTYTTYGNSEKELEEKKNFDQENLEKVKKIYKYIKGKDLYLYIETVGTLYEKLRIEKEIFDKVKKVRIIKQEISLKTAVIKGERIDGSFFLNGEAVLDGYDYVNQRRYHHHQMVEPYLYYKKSMINFYGDKGEYTIESPDEEVIEKFLKNMNKDIEVIRD